MKWGFSETIELALRYYRFMGSTNFSPELLTTAKVLNFIRRTTTKMYWKIPMKKKNGFFFMSESLTNEICCFCIWVAPSKPWIWHRLRHWAIDRARCVLHNVDSTFPTRWLSRLMLIHLSHTRSTPQVSYYIVLGIGVKNKTTFLERQ